MVAGDGAGDHGDDGAADQPRDGAQGARGRGGARGVLGAGGGAGAAGGTRAGALRADQGEGTQGAGISAACCIAQNASFLLTRAGRVAVKIKTIEIS